MPGIQLGGLISGMDTEGMISQLMALERVPRNRLLLDQTAATTRQQALRDVQSRLKTLRYATQDLASSALWSPKQTIGSSDETKISARMNAGAAPGGYSLAVTQMATAAQKTYTWTPQAAQSTLDINGVTVTIEPNADLDNAVSTINSNASLGVFAVNVGSKLVLTSRATGAAAAVNATGGAVAFDTGTAKAGQDAQFTINGGPLQSSATNVVNDAITGVELTIKALTPGTSITVSTPATDRQAVKDKLKAFVAAYNDAAEFITSKTSEKKVVSTDGKPLSSSDAAKGALFGDTGLRTALSSMRMSIGSEIAGLPTPYNSLASIGISTGETTGGGATNADSVKGKLTFDEKKFDAAFDADPLAVQKMLGGVIGTNGFSHAFQGVVEPMVIADGTFDQRIDSADDELKRIRDAITRFDDRLSLREERLRKQFTAMELAMQRSQSQSADLIARLGQPSR
jgi:flagellar hook-associated protein 2